MKGRVGLEMRLIAIYALAKMIPPDDNPSLSLNISRSGTAHQSRMPVLPCP